MTREEAKELLPIIQAFTEGKTIQFRTNNRSWVDLLEGLLSSQYHIMIAYSIALSERMRLM